MKLEGKVAIVTGGASGIGKAIVELFVEEGARVVIADISKQGEGLARKLGSNALFVRTDVSVEKDIENMVQEAVGSFGKVDILVNNAGIGKAIPIEGMRKEDWDKVIGTNLTGVFLGTKHVIPVMKRQKKGVIINTGSELSFVGDPLWSSYAASKGGILQFTKVSAIELIDFGIRVNSLCPGPTATPMLLEGISKDEMDRIKNHVPMRRLGKPEEIAKGALFLASEDSSFMTGAFLLMDGGVIAKE